VQPLVRISCPGSPIPWSVVNRWVGALCDRVRVSVGAVTLVFIAAAVL